MFWLSKHRKFLNIGKVTARFLCFSQSTTNRKSEIPSNMSSNKWDKDEREFELNAETELRFEVAERSNAHLQLKCGSAECFGTELHRDRKYTFRSKAKASIFTWYGCTVVLTGSTSHASIVKDTPMIIYANLHASIEQMRQNAENHGKKGPTVLVAGPKDVGKSTLCRILLNYAVRQGRKPVFVDLDAGQGQISIPGTLGALQLESQLNVEDTFSEHEPLLYHFGFKSPGHSLVLYKALTSRIASVMNLRMTTNRAASFSGIIINTCGWVKSHGYRLITDAALVFEVDVILVIGQHSLYKQLMKDIPRFVKIVFVPKTTSVFERSQEERAEARDNYVKEYFYGFKNQLNCHQIDIPFSEAMIYRIDADTSDSYFPTGTKYYENHLCLIPVEIGYNLVNHILSLSFATSTEDDVVGTNIAGFVCVTKVDMNKRCLTVLSPHPAPLPKNILLLSEVIFKPHLS